MKIKLFFEDLAIVKYPYSHNRYCVDMGVLTFENEKEARDYVSRERCENPNKTRRFFIIEYKKGTTIGKLSRHINQCFGNSQSSFERDLALVNQMYAYIREFGFEELEPQNHSEMDAKMNHTGSDQFIRRYWFKSKKVGA